MTRAPSFFTNVPGKHILNKGLSDLHANDMQGILHTGIEAAVAVLEEETQRSLASARTKAETRVAYISSRGRTAPRAILSRGTYRRKTRFMIT